MISSVGTAQTGLYRCVVQATCGSATSNEATLTLRPVRGDMDGDRDVDGADLALMRDCLSGPYVPAETLPPCVNADIDHDNDADLSDFALFQLCLSGSYMPPLPECIE